ncbi:hypothetical protein ACQ86N_01215 [Puia sp. P3]|uniref:hypothetical protein n=1 Tax=Puia sp. P3 TaxID=3423952 RepID=UPI003D668A83
MKQIVRGSLCLFVSTLLCRPFAVAQCTGDNNPTSTGANAGSGGSSWVNPNNIQSTDGSVASVSAVVSALSIITTTTDYLNVTNLGLNVPSANTICGVAVTINRQTFSLLTLGTSTVSDNSIMLLKGASGSAPITPLPVWPGRHRWARLSTAVLPTYGVRRSCRPTSTAPALAWPFLLN